MLEANLLSVMPEDLHLKVTHLALFNRMGHLINLFLKSPTYFSFLL